MRGLCIVAVFILILTSCQCQTDTTESTTDVLTTNPRVPTSLGTSADITTPSAPTPPGPTTISHGSTGDVTNPSGQTMISTVSSGSTANPTISSVQTVTSTTPSSVTTNNTAPTGPTPSITISSSQTGSSITSSGMMTSGTTPTSQTTNIPTSQNATIILTSPTAPAPLLTQLLDCDFSSGLCFQNNNDVKITNGSEFTPTNLSDSEPPPAPTSDATSVNKPTNNGETCQLPFRPSSENSSNGTSWDMWFCYKNQCPAPDQLATCASGAYGLIDLSSSTPNTTITQSINGTTTFRDSAGNQCLRFQYYFTVYNQTDSDQQLQVAIRMNNQIDNQSIIETLTVADMKENRWYFHNVTFDLSQTNYMLVFSFQAAFNNESTINTTIYFALDDIQVYDNNCSYVAEILAQTSTTSIPTVTNPTVTPDPPSKRNLGLILGLTLGLGIPILLGIIAGAVVFYLKKRRN